MGGNYYVDETSATPQLPPQVVVPAILLRPEAAAAALGICPRTLATWVKAGMVPSFKIGRCRLFEVESLKTWAREQATADAKSEGVA